MNTLLRLLESMSGRQLKLALIFFACGTAIAVGILWGSNLDAFSSIRTTGDWFDLLVGLVVLVCGQFLLLILFGAFFGLLLGEGAKEFLNSIAFTTTGWLSVMLASSAAWAWYRQVV